MAMKPTDTHGTNQNWHDELRVWPRTPFPGTGELLVFLGNSWPTEVFLRENKKTTDIVLRLPLSSSQLPENLRNAFSHAGISLSRAFDEVVWDAPRTKERSFWAQLAKSGNDAYWEAWMQLLRVSYRQRFEQKVDKKLGNWLDDFKVHKKQGSAGRRKESDAERGSLCRRFQELLTWSQRIHELVKKSNKTKLNRFEIRLTVMKAIYGQRGDDAVLSGRAFTHMPNKNSELHVAKTWKPKQLATALLGIERGGREYATIRRKIGKCNTKKVAS